MKELIIDCFAGGGGASVGIEMAQLKRKGMDLGLLYPHIKTKKEKDLQLRMN